MVNSVGRYKDPVCMKLKVYKAKHDSTKDWNRQIHNGIRKQKFSSDIEDLNNMI